MTMKQAILLSLLAALPATYAQKYEGAGRNGADVIGCWEFNQGKETEDSSGKGHTLNFSDKAKLIPDGIDGPALASEGCTARLRSNPNSAGDVPKGAWTIGKDLSPKGAFTAEISFKLNDDFNDYSQFFLMDKMVFHYASTASTANRDFGFMCLYGWGVQKVVFQVNLGFGKDSEFVSSETETLNPGQWYHAAFTYDGQGLVTIFLDGKRIKRVFLPGRGPITPSNNKLFLGDRAGSTYSTLPGAIDQARLMNGIPPEYAPTPELSMGESRTAFYRFEKNTKCKLTLDNPLTSPIDGGTVQFTINGKTQSIAIPTIPAHGQNTFDLNIDATLAADEYPLNATATLKIAGKESVINYDTSIAIVNREPKFFPVVMWGTGDIPRLKDIGFTHDLRHFGNFNDTWSSNSDNAKPARNHLAVVNMMNEHTRQNMHVCLTTAPGSWLRYQKDPKLHRIEKDGSVGKTINIALPQVQQFGYNVGRNTAKQYAHFPIFDLALIHSEIRDGTAISFDKDSMKAAEEFIGGPVPDCITVKKGVHYQTIPNFPANRIIKDDDPILKFYTWFWKDGDGWNPLHTQIKNGLQSTERKDIKTFFDPAVRVPSIWGSGGKVEYLSQWTYSYPDPIKIGQATDDLFAMAEGCPEQEVMKMTQIIWYRSQTTVRNHKDKSLRAQWEIDLPNCDFNTISPDHLSEAFWSMIARPIKGIMYHGWGSLVDTKSTTSYCFTNPDTAPRLKSLISSVIRPLGPTLLQVPDMPADVAILQSFSSQVFAERGGAGWSNSWEANMHLILQWAGIQPKIVYDESIRNGALKGVKVLVMPYCDVLTESVYNTVKAFQEQGGIIIADQYLAPALLPDCLVRTYIRQGNAREDKDALLAMAAKLKAELSCIYTPAVKTSNPEIVPRMRQYKSSRYLFTINDNRTFGKYVGQYKIVMEDGLPSTAEINIPGQGFVYDLVSHNPVKTQNKEGMTTVQNYGPGEGKLFLITEKAIDKVVVQASNVAIAGTTFPVKVSVVDSKNTAIDAVIPVQISIIEPDGKAGEFSGYYGAKDGVLNLELAPATNGTRGKWTITATELASGKSTTHTFNLK